ncbi:alkylphosphocholine resistance protein lem3 [Coemansia guatemalensis]|uniref:Alkylphosphocholine resistance protein lem3 n=1 Tax=Coemansia guatemalensis TaxID=2761395 RepID=A0A9W8LU20_9FUNG|nr:alkylphosphocholine resistance protein lem3 [Coemansia guatemalensis]
MRIDYTNCDQLSGTLQDVGTGDYEYHMQGIESSTIAKPRESYDESSRTCTIEFTMPRDLEPGVFLYYRLTNFYQNHRRYTRSFDVDQLKGKRRSVSDLDGGDCSPLDAVTINGTRRPYYPCGLIANSVFNDTISQPVMANPSGDQESGTYSMTEKDISWEADRKRFNPTDYKPDEVYPPPNWVERYGDTYDEMPKLEEDEHFMVWMRTAGLPTFRKLYMKNTEDTMKSGIYQVEVVMNFDTRSFGGTKSIVISTTSFIGGRNPVLGIAFIVVGGLCVLLGCIFAVRHLYRPRRLGDHTYLSWNQQVSSGLADNGNQGSRGVMNMPNSAASATTGRSKNPTEGPDLLRQRP